MLLNVMYTGMLVPPISKKTTIIDFTNALTGRVSGLCDGDELDEKAEVVFITNHK